jgi:hypothetical protein
MGAPRYSAEERLKAMGALWGSAREVDGVWKPNYRATAKVTKVSEGTLRLWWKSRDITQDYAFMQAAGLAAERAMELGSAQWFDSMRRKLKDRLQWIVDNQEAWESNTPDRNAKAVQFIAQSLASMDKGTGGVARDDRVGRYKKAAGKAKVDP